MSAHTSGLTVAQKKLRLGYFNSSSVEALLKPKGFGDTGMSYIFKKAAERDTGELQDEIFTTPQMQWGIDHEAEAISELNKILGQSFIKNDEILLKESLNLSGTPDIINGVEIKCPTSAKHLQYRQMHDGEDLKKVVPVYYWQCVAYMVLTNAREWMFVSYDPRNKGKELFMLNFTVEQSEIDFFINRLKMAKNILNEI